MVHCSNYEDNSYQAYPFSTLEKARMWLSTCGYDCVVVSTAMIDDPGYGNRLDS